MVDIERAAHRTEVIVDEGINTVSYALDESLIYFGAALEDQDFEHAAEVSGSRRYFFLGGGGLGCQAFRGRIGGPGL